MQRTKCLHVCLHIDWNPYGTFKNQITGLEKDLNCKIYISDVASDVRLVTFVKDNFKKYVRFEQVAVGRATCLQLQNENYNYNIINVYGPAYHSSTDYINFCESIFKYTDTHTDAVLMGMIMTPGPKS